ncbi:MAG TPA: hypothetical protein VF182_04175 [Candidatus Binatia bacterium]
MITDIQQAPTLFHKKTVDRTVFIRSMIGAPIPATGYPARSTKLDEHCQLRAEFEARHLSAPDPCVS